MLLERELLEAKIAVLEVRDPRPLVGGGRGDEPDHFARQRHSLRAGPGVPGLAHLAGHGLPPPLPPLTNPPARRGPSGPMPDAALVEAIRAVLSSSPFHGEGHRKLWARLRIAGVRTSKRRVLRLMREHGLLAPSRVGAPRGPRNHDATIIPNRVNEMWGTDLTVTWTGEGQAVV